MRLANPFAKPEVSRRAFLRGAGVCLALPWLEAFTGRTARGQASTPLRFVPIFFPNGAAADFWGPSGEGRGDAWSLSPILQPLAPLKPKMTVLTNVENYTSMQDNPGVEPSHARCAGAFLTCVDADLARQELRVEVANGTSFDQVLAQNLPRETPFASLQVGLSTIESFCDGRHCSLSQSISWKSPTEPLYKEVNPQTVFDTLVGSLNAGGSAEADLESQRRRALEQSVLDAVAESATRTRLRLGFDDSHRLDQFLESVREVETQVQNMGNPARSSTCEPLARPDLAASYGLANGQNGYHRGNHAAVMNKLVLLALQCDATRIISYMLDDARSDFVYDHLQNRRFDPSGSEPDNGQVGGYHGLQHAGDSNNGYATINWWLTQQVCDLCQMLDAIDEGGRSLLDNSVVLYGSGMHGTNHDANELPLVLLGSGGGRLRTDQHIKFPPTPNDRPLRDLYFTLAKEIYDADISGFGRSIKGANHQLMSEILV